MRPLLFVLSSLAIGSSAHAERYAITPLPTNFFPIDLNDHGQILGYYRYLFQGSLQPVVYDHGVFTPIELSGATNHLTVRAINNAGQVVGYTGSSDDVHAFVWDTANGVSFFEPPGATSSSATDINNRGEIAFHVDDLAAVRKSSGELAPLGSLGSGADVSALNDQGDVVGFAATINPSANFPVIHAFLWRDGVMQDLNVAAHVPGGQTSYECAYDVNNAGVAVGAAVVYQTVGDPPIYGFVATLDSVQTFPNTELLSINNQGQAVGTVGAYGQSSAPDAYVAALYENGVVVDLNTLINSNSEFVLVNAMRINNHGQILAGGFLRSGAPTLNRPLLLNPVPEPASWILVVAAGSIAILNRRRRCMLLPIQC